MAEKVMIKAENISKSFRIYTDKPMTLKDRTLSVIKKNYTEFKAVDDISMEIYSGSAVLSYEKTEAENQLY